MIPLGKRAIVNTCVASEAEFSSKGVLRLLFIYPIGRQENIMISWKKLLFAPCMLI